MPSAMTREMLITAREAAERPTGMTYTYCKYLWLTTLVPLAIRRNAFKARAVLSNVRSATDL